MQRDTSFRLRKRGTPLWIRELQKKGQQMSPPPFRMPRYSTKPSQKQKPVSNKSTDQPPFCPLTKPARCTKNTSVHFEDDDPPALRKPQANFKGSGSPPVGSLDETLRKQPGCLETCVKALNNEFPLTKNSNRQLQIRTFPSSKNKSKPWNGGPRVAAALSTTQAVCKPSNTSNEHAQSAFRSTGRCIRKCFKTAESGPPLTTLKKRGWCNQNPLVHEESHVIHVKIHQKLCGEPLDDEPAKRGDTESVLHPVADNTSANPLKHLELEVNRRSSHQQEKCNNLPRFMRKTHQPNIGRRPKSLPESYKSAKVSHGPLADHSLHWKIAKPLTSRENRLSTTLTKQQFENAAAADGIPLKMSTPNHAVASFGGCGEATWQWMTYPLKEKRESENFSQWADACYSLEDGVAPRKHGERLAGSESCTSFVTAVSHFL